jgi:hypothetical protein
VIIAFLAGPSPDAPKHIGRGAGAAAGRRTSKQQAETPQIKNKLKKFS